MTFTIQCPNCQKAYTADPQWIGKRIRCKKCATAFVVEQQPVEAPAAIEQAPDPLPAESSNVAEQRDPLLELGDLTSKSRVRDSHASPARARIEAQLRRLVVVLALAVSALATVRQNKTGVVGFTFLRLGTAALLFLLLVLPVTVQSIAGSFRRWRLKPPPSTAARAAATFVLPASLGYAAWQLHQSTGSLLIGLLAALPLMFIVFWFEFRARFLESLAGYIRACFWFLLGSALAAAIVVGVNFVINQALINAHAVSYAQSPLGESLPWKTPQPAPVAANELQTSQHAATRSASAAQNHATPGLFDLGDAMLNAPPAPQSRPGGALFVNPEDDQYLADLQKNSPPWIRQVSRPTGQSPFDFLVAPGVAAPYIGFVSLDPAAPGTRRFAVAVAINSRVGRAASFDITHDANPHAFVREFVLSNDGTLLLHLNGLAMEMISTATHRRDTFALVIPEQAPRAKLTPELVGVARDQEVIVRWSAEGAAIQVLQRYSYAARSLTETSEIADAAPATESAAVSGNPAGSIWFTSIVTPARLPRSLCLVDLNKRHSAPNYAPMPVEVRELRDYETVELAFSPGAGHIALLLTDRARAVVYVWKSSALSREPLKVSPPMLAPALTSSHVAGPRIRWIDDDALLVDGQSVISTVPGHAGLIGLISETAALGATTIAPDHMLLSYLGADNLCHLAEIEFDAQALHAASPAK